MSRGRTIVLQPVRQERNSISEKKNSNNDNKKKNSLGNIVEPSSKNFSHLNKLKELGPALWETKLGGLLEFRSSRSAWAT